MNSNGVILRRLRQINRLTIKQAAKKIGRSAGWISEVENGNGQAKIFPDEFERIVRELGGDAYRRQFGGWIRAVTVHPKDQRTISFDGAVLKYLRNKAELSVRAAALRAEMSAAYLSYLETGRKPLSVPTRNRLLGIYGYSPSSFKNFASEDKRAKNIPVLFKLQTLLRNFDDAKIDAVFRFAAGLGLSGNSEIQVCA